MTVAVLTRGGGSAGPSQRRPLSPAPTQHLCLPPPVLSRGSLDSRGWTRGVRADLGDTASLCPSGVRSQEPQLGASCRLQQSRAPGTNACAHKRTGPPQAGTVRWPGGASPPCRAWPPRAERDGGEGASATNPKCRCR